MACCILVQQILPSLLDPPILFAHRGARAYAPENTIEAFVLALKLGATGLESDVWLTADGEVVCDHDGVVRTGRMRRSTPIAELRRSQLPAHVPTLEQVIDVCGPETHLSLDLKDPSAGPAVVNFVREIDADMIPRLWLRSQTLSVLETLRALEDDVRLVDAPRSLNLSEGLERRAAHLAAKAIDGVALPYSHCTGGIIVLFHRFDRVVFGRQLQHQHQLSSVLRMGSDGVSSDYPDRIVDALTAASEEPTCGLP